MLGMIKFSVTLQDGTTHTFTAKRQPRHWKSWVMQQCPYGTDFQGATFARSDQDQRGRMTDVGWRYDAFDCANEHRYDPEFEIRDA